MADPEMFPISIPRSLVEYILLGPAGDRRQLQDSPILGDVWIAFAKDPDRAQDLLITPHRSQSAGEVALYLDSLIQDTAQEPTHIGFLQGIIAARLDFPHVLLAVVPLTEWWRSPRNNREMKVYLERAPGLQRLLKVLNTTQMMIDHWSGLRSERVGDFLTSFERYAALAGLILWAKGKKILEPEKQDKTKILAEAVRSALNEIAQGLSDIFNEILTKFPPQEEKKPGAPKTTNKEERPKIFQVSLNREATMALERSVLAVKGDAARTLFKVDCSEIGWAVIDSGIHAKHTAFRDSTGKDRVKRIFDFSTIRKIVSLDNLRVLNGKDETAKEILLSELIREELLEPLDAKKAIEKLTRLSQDAREGRPIYWEFVRPFVELKVDTRADVSDHGTHVAGIIGAARNEAKYLGKDEDARDYFDGMCPDIQLFDFRVLGSNIKDTEFAIIAALQFIRHLNQQREYITIHGANLSLSIPHDVRNYACGRTPVCVEAERLVDSGVVVVAAAGNRGYQTFETKDGSYEGYTAFSITDPGNADGVITVGATHRHSPHTYGVSFFSSRGPTGDGRIKPDLVAPGERIRAPFRDGWGDLDGTSMAAPHVSGAAAMLMARYPEMIGFPRRIKRILCESATDLGREKTFQGNGMLDVLRAFQSI